jgi:hypothetical protein
VLKVNDVLGTCYDDPVERADNSNANLELLMSISLTAPRPGASAPAELPTRKTLSPRARVTSTSSTHSAHSAARRLCSRLIPRLTAIAFLVAIKRALAGKVDEGHTDVAGYADSLVPVLYGLCVHAALHDGDGPATDVRVVGVACDIIGLGPVVQSLA